MQSVADITALVSSRHVKESLPLPGEPDSSPGLEDGRSSDMTGSFAAFQQHSNHAFEKSESQHSISSTWNECGHYAEAAPHVAMYNEGRHTTIVSRDESIENDIDGASKSDLNLHDTSLIGGFRPQHAIRKMKDSYESRPVSPFSPAGTISEAFQTETTPNSCDADRDLINLDSDQESLQDLPLSYPSSAMQRFNGTETDIDSDADPFPDEEEELDGNPLYSSLTSNGSSYVRRAWEASQVILIPPRFSLPPEYLSAEKDFSGENARDVEIADWERYTAMHALHQQVGSKDTYVGYGRSNEGRRLHAKLDSLRGEVEISLHTDGDASDMPEERSDISIQPGSLGEPSLSPMETLNTIGSLSTTGPSHLPAGWSPTSSSESGNFPITPPISPSMRPNIAVRSASVHARSGFTSNGIAFPGMVPLIPLPKQLQASTRILKIVGETPVYRRRRKASAASAAMVSASAPTFLPQGSSLSTKAISADPPNPLSVISSTSSLVTSKTLKKKDSKVRLRIPKWLTRTSKENLKSVESAPVTPVRAHQPAFRTSIIQEEVQPVIEKLRIIRVDTHVIRWPGEHTGTMSSSANPVSQSMQARPLRQEMSRQSIASSSAISTRQYSDSSRFSRRSSTMVRSDDTHTTIESQPPVQQPYKDFSADLAYLLDPPRTLPHLAIPFEMSLREIISLTKEFCESILYVQGGEQYVMQVREKLLHTFQAQLNAFTSQRLREGILDLAWAKFEQQNMTSGQRDRLLEVFEK